MEINVSKEKNYIRIEKNMKEDLKNFNLNFKILIIIIVFIIFLTVSWLGMLIIYSLLIIQLIFFLKQVKYIYCDEVLEFKNNILIIKFIFKENILYEKNIELQSIQKIYISKNIKYKVISFDFSENKILSPAFEARRRLKFLLKTEECYSWGRNINDVEIKKVFLEVNNFFHNQKIENNSL